MLAVVKWKPLWLLQFPCLLCPWDRILSSTTASIGKDRSIYDYRTNVDSYPKWQAWMRERQLLLMVIWAKYDLSFDPGEPERYRKDVPNAQIHVLNAGHFALDTAADAIAELIENFIASSYSEMRVRRAG